MATRISRREVLAGAATLALGAASSCTPHDSSDPPARPSAAIRRAVAKHNQAIRADLALLDAAVVAEQRLLQRCQAILRHHPGLGGALHPVVRAHRVHLRVLDDLWRSTPRQPSVAARAVPAHSPTAVAQLRRAEQRAVDARLHDCLAAQSAQLAQLLASIAASGAQSASLLTGVR